MWAGEWLLLVISEPLPPSSKGHHAAVSYSLMLAFISTESGKGAPWHPSVQPEDSEPRHRHVSYVRTRCGRKNFLGPVPQ